MTIDRISSIDPVLTGRKTGQNSRMSPAGKPDSIALSPEAVGRSELYRAIELVSGAPEVRSERVAELKTKINDPAYLDGAISAAADRLMDVFGL